MLAAALVLVGCAGDDDEPIDAEEVGAADVTVATEPVDDVPADPAVDEDLPDPEDFEGEVRLLNLYVDGDGATLDVDLWAVRSFTHGPSLLVEGLAPGEVSAYMAAPSGQRLVVVPAGASPDDPDSDLGGIFGPADGELITGILTWSDGTAAVASVWDRSSEDRSDVEPPPGDDEALVIVRAGQLWAHEDALVDAYGGRSFNVGDGSGSCLPQQRIEAEGFAPAVLGGTNPTVHVVAPGSVTLSFHRWPDDGECADDPVLGPVEVTTSPGETTLVVLWTPDRRTIDVVTLPVG